MSRLLITGGAGFIGVNAASHFAKAGWSVTVVDNLSRAGSERNMRWLLAHHRPSVAFVEADVRDRSAIAEAVANQDAVLHLAGQVAVRFDFRLNAAPSKPLFPGSPTVQAWLVAGNVGLYQVNVVVPLQLPHSAGSCGCPNGPSGCPGPFQLTIDLGGLSSYDGAQICVAVAPH